MQFSPDNVSLWVWRLSFMLAPSVTRTTLASTLSLSHIPSSPHSHPCPFYYLRQWLTKWTRLVMNLFFDTGLSLLSSWLTVLCPPTQCCVFIVAVVFLHVCTLHACLGPAEGKRWHWVPESCGCWEPNSGLLQEQQVLLTSEPLKA